MSLIPVVIDYETLFGDDYTLSKMNTESYVRDKRFEAHGAAVKWSPSTSAVWYDDRELRYHFKNEDWSDKFVIHHHAQFDSLIMSHHYGVVPKMVGCTLAMSRLMLGNHIGVSLDSVRSQFGIPAKSTPYKLFRNKRWNELTPQVQQLLGEGACDEVESIWKIFCILMQQGFPVEELDCIDTTIKMFSDPVLRANTEMLAQVWEREVSRKAERQALLNVTPKQIGSNEVFASMLRERGVEPEMKDGKNGPIYAFAKTDTFMEKLLGDESDEIRALAEARLEVKSTLLQTRAETLGWMASRGSLCVYLRYAGAHTSRWSGGDGSNWQNFTNEDEDTVGEVTINNAIMAPEGYLLAAPDASQIECRLLNALAGQEDKVEDFRLGRDPYIGVASQFYGRPITKADKDERQCGKVLELQCGFGSGGPKIAATLRIKTKGKIILDAAGALRARDAYRDTHPKVKELWWFAENVLGRMANHESFAWGPMWVQCNAARGTKRIVLPNGIHLIYDTLQWHKPDDVEIEKTGDSSAYWRLKTRHGWAKLYGAKLCENVIQALARVVVSQAMLRLKYMGYRTVSMKHDELWILVPKDGREEEHRQVLIREMSRQLLWMPDVPLNAECVMGERYSK